MSGQDGWGDDSRAGLIQPQLLEQCAPLQVWQPGDVGAIQVQNVEHDERSRRLLREHSHAGIGWMNPLLQGLEIQAVIGGDDDLTVDHATARQLGRDGRDQFGEVARHRPLVSAAQLHLVAVAEANRPEPIPFGLVRGAGWDRGNRFRQHRRDRRHDGQLHRVRVMGGRL